MSRRKEEAIAAGVQVNETKHSMKRRKPWHDYRCKGTYMLTLVVAERRPLLGRLVASEGGVPAVGLPAVETAGVEAVAERGNTVAERGRRTSEIVGARVELTRLGRVIRDEEVRKISDIYKMVEVWKLCIMPDHIHMIVRVKEDMPDEKHLGIVIRGFKAGCSRAWWRERGPCVKTQGVEAVDSTSASAVEVATTPAASTAGKTAGKIAGKIAGKTAGEAASKAGPSLFESGYNDLILLGDGQLDNWKRYLNDNPRRLAIKRKHPELFTTMHYVDIAQWHCQAVGNRFLLDIPQKVAVIVHRAYTDKDFAEKKAEWLACGEAGGVLVSAAIASREKEVMREAMDRGYRIILVRENGFPALYKPAGESFDACSEGRLLQVCPWEYHMERRVISREQCLSLNRLVEFIACH